ncbi:MAG: XTP/dITP diphosphatase [Clostridia bacterium]|nr:XTP/dITP diphosphatase [Clostridia bacterium]
MKIIAATQNTHKLKEMSDILRDFGMEILSQREAGLEDIDIEETGETFEENSAIKAKAICQMTGFIAIADDSGLAVDVLNGEPGVYSARYSGPDANDASNNAKLLAALKNVEESQRTGKYVSVITLAYPDGRILSSRGECPGILLRSPRGEGGFGYDPLFIPEGANKTFAEMSAQEKNQISHRAKALWGLRELLKNNED